MPRFSANLSMLFTEHDFLDRFAAADDAGFTGVEYIGPYEHEPDEIAKRLARHGLTQALFNLPMGDMEAGDRGFAIFDDRRAEFRAGVEAAIQYAKALDCAQVNCIAGIAPAGVAPEELEGVLVDNLRFAADRLGEAGVRLVIEPINRRDMPGFFVTGSAQTLRIIDKVGSDNLKLQYDFYHMQIMEGDLARRVEELLPRIGHIQFADNPGRHEPGSGEVNFAFLFAHLDKIGYSGWVGAEYRPLTTTAASLDWMKPYLGRGD